MRVKKFRKCQMANEEKGNIDTNCGELRDENCLTNMLNDANITYNPLFMYTNEEKKQGQNSTNIEFSIKENKGTQEKLDNISTLTDISNKSNDIETLILEGSHTKMNVLIDPQVCFGQKRPIEDDGNETSNIMQLKKQCMELQARVQELESEAHQGRLSVLHNFFNGIDILYGIDQNNSIDNAADILKAIEIINIDKNTLLKLKKQTATATARSILKFKFPNPDSNFKLADIDKALTDAIILYSKQLNPYDSSSNSKIRKAMSNVFALNTYRKKIKLMMTSNKPIEEQ